MDTQLLHLGAEKLARSIRLLLKPSSDHARLVKR